MDDPMSSSSESSDNEVTIKRDRLLFQLVYSGFLISGVIALLVIGGVIYLSVAGPTNQNGDPIVPEVLQNWGGIIVGFYFGTFVSLIKDYMKKT